MNTELNNYDLKAVQFLADTKTNMQVEYIFTGKYFLDDTESRDVYRITLTNPKGEHSFRFGDSLRNTQRPAAHKRIPGAYAVLANLYMPVAYTFDEFCQDTGYSNSPLSEYKKVLEIYTNGQMLNRALTRMFTEEQLLQLLEIN